MLQAWRDYCTHTRAVLLQVRAERGRLVLVNESIALENEEPASLGRNRNGIGATEMAKHVIVGAGAVGSATGLLLAERGEQVRIVTRRGSGPDHAGIEKVA